MGLSSILFWFKSSQSKHFLYLKACVLHKFMITFRFAYVYPLANLCCRESVHLSHSLSRSMLFYQNLAFLSNIPLNTQTLYKSLLFCVYNILIQKHTKIIINKTFYMREYAGARLPLKFISLYLVFRLKVKTKGYPIVCEWNH